MEEEGRVFLSRQGVNSLLTYKEQREEAAERQAYSILNSRKKEIELFSYYKHV